MKKNPKPINKFQDNIQYLKNNDNTEAKRVVFESKDLPHLQKPIKYMIK